MFKKNPYIFLAIVPILLIVVGMVFWKVRAKESIFAGPAITPQTDLNVADSGPKAILTKESGTVSYKLPQSAEFIALDTEVEVPTGTSVKTAEGLAHVLLPDNSLMSMSKNTEVTLNFEGNKTSIVQILGNTWHRVEKVLQGNEYEVQTPNALATVRGTEFNIGIDENNVSEVYVIESVVDVSMMKKNGDEMELLETKKIEADKHVFVPVVDEDKPSTDEMEVITMPENKKNTAWFQRNKVITENIKSEEEKQLSPLPTQANSNAKETPNMNDEKQKTIRKNIMESVKEDKKVEELDTRFKFRVKEEVKGVSTETENDFGRGGRPSPTRSIERQGDTKQQPTATPTKTSDRQTVTKVQPTATPTKTSDRTTDLKPTATLASRTEPTKAPEPTKVPIATEKPVTIEKEISYEEMAKAVFSRYSKSDVETWAKENRMTIEDMVKKIYYEKIR